MKNNILLVEINRVNELIGNKKILNEQWVSKIVTGVLRFVDDASKKGWKVGASVENEIAALSKAASDEEAIKILAKISNSSKEFQDIILPEVMKSLSKEVKDEILNITNLAKKELDSGKSIDDVNSLVDKQMSKIKSDFEGVNDILKKQIKDELSTYKPNVKPKPEPSNTDLTIRDAMEKAFSQWDSIAPGKLTLKDKTLLTDSFWFRGMRAQINRAFNNFFKKQDESLKRIVELSKQANEDILNAQKRKTLYKTIDQEIENLRKNEDFVKENALEIFNVELAKKIGYGKANEITNTLKNSQSLSDDYPSYFQYLMDETYIGKMRKLPVYPKGHAREGKVDWSRAISNTLERTAMFLTSGNPRKISEIYNEFIATYGKKWWKGAIYYYAWMWGIKRTIFPVIFGLLDELYYGWNRETGSEDYGNFLQTWGHFIKERIKDTLVAYDKTFDKVSGMNKYEIDTKNTILKIINPWELLWDDIFKYADWHNEGGARNAWERFYSNSRDRFEKSEVVKALIKQQQELDSLSKERGKKIDSLMDKIKILDSALGTLESPNKQNSDDTIKPW